MREIVPVPASPVRRSGATNRAPQRLQAEFINAARAAMGHPMEDDAWALLGEYVTVVFNGDHAPVSGILTGIVDHPTGPRLVLNHNKKVTFPLASIQSIERYTRPELLP
jgi:hypothetical protein